MLVKWEGGSEDKDNPLASGEHEYVSGLPPLKETMVSCELLLPLEHL